LKFFNGLAVPGYSKKRKDVFCGLNLKGRRLPLAIRHWKKWHSKQGRSEGKVQFTGEARKKNPAIKVPLLVR